MSGRLKRPLISIVMPSYNDEPIILPYYEAIKKTLGDQKTFDYELVYVDDGSTDGSQNTLERLANEDPRVCFIELYRNFGQQRALFAGMSHAVGDYVITLDGDYQYPPQVIIQLAEALRKGPELVSGIRKGRRDPLFSRIASGIGNHIIRSILKVNLQDFGSVKAFRRDLVDRILAMRHYFSDVYPAALSLRPKLAEIEVEHLGRSLGRSHWDIWMRIKLYLDIYVSYSDDQFTGIFRAGILLIVAGIIGSAVMVLWKLLLGHQASLLQIVTGGYLISFTGGALIGWTLLMTFVTRIYKQNVLNEPFAIRRILRRDDSARLTSAQKQDAGA